MLEMHIRETLKACSQAQKCLGDQVSFRTRTLLGMLILELEKERAVLAERDRTKDSDRAVS